MRARSAMRSTDGNIRMDTISGMVTFARVVEANSFSEAARRLGISKSAVSKQVARLEDHLGARLLNRTTRRISPTEVGTAFYERCVARLKLIGGVVVYRQDVPQEGRIDHGRLTAQRGIGRRVVPVQITPGRRKSSHDLLCSGTSRRRAGAPPRR